MSSGPIRSARERPNRPVFSVDDGSRDGTAAICAAYPFIKLIRQSNRGLSAARNVGLEAASGSIVAYTDADCDVDPDWLTYLVTTMETSGAVAAGGPNYPPAEDSLVPSCVAVSPGGPTHVLLDDAVAEHIAGCNMAFRADVLRNLGGFDPQFRAAGDDIDICWRLQDLGYTIAFSPAVLVWHYRCCRVRDYLNQQRGYGRAEARVFVKHPGRFNPFGQARWSGRLYGGQQGITPLSRPFIDWGLFGLAPFQLLYQTAEPAWANLPLTLEWLLGCLLLTALLKLASLPPLWGLLPLLLTILAAALGAWTVPLDPRFRGPRARLLVTLLVLAGPMLRSWERYRWRWLLSRPTAAEGPTPRGWEQAWWSEAWIERHVLLQELLEALRRRGRPVAPAAGWWSWDLEVSQGLWGVLLLRSCAENHGGPKRLFRFRWRLRLSALSGALLVLLPLLVLLALGLHQPLAAAGVAGFAAFLFTRIALDLGRLRADLARECHQVCKEAGLLPLSAPGGSQKPRPAATS